jgi:Spy/CpxP family protein refolding chaperone
MSKGWLALFMGGVFLTTPVVTPLVQAEPNALNQLFPVLVGIQLTPEQQTQLKQLSDKLLPQVKKSLSPDQQEQFDHSVAHNSGVRVALVSLNLSLPQKLKIRGVLAETQSQIAQILTPEQQQQLSHNLYSLQQHSR